MEVEPNRSLGHWDRLLNYLLLRCMARRKLRLALAGDDGPHHHDHAQHKGTGDNNGNWAKDEALRPRRAGAGTQRIPTGRCGCRVWEQRQQGAHPILPDFTVAGIQVALVAHLSELNG